MPISQKYPTIRPNMLLDFANSKVLDPRITFTRASTATFRNDVGLIEVAPVGAARFDHNPATGESLGLLIEEQRVNYFLNSDQTQLSSTPLNSVINGNAVISPDGQLNGATITANSGSAQHGVTKNSTALPASSVITLSAFVKAGTHRYCRIDSANVTNWAANTGFSVDLLTGTVISGTGQIELFSNGWYRLSTQATSNATSGVTRGIWVWLAGSDGNSTFNATGTETIHVFGMSSEVGAFPTSYIPTVASQVTRSADAASMTGTNFSSWFNAVEGSFLWQGQTANASSGFPRFFSAALTSNPFDNFIQVFVNESANSIGGEIRKNAVFEGSFTIKTSYTGQPVSVALAYQENNFAGVADGGTIASDTVGTVATVDVLYIGNIAGGSHITGTIKKIAYYDQRLSNANLPVLTA